MPSVTRLALNSALPTYIARELLKYTMPNLTMAGKVTRADKWSGVQSYGGVIQIPTFLARPTPTQLNTGADAPWGGSAEASPPAVSFSVPSIASVTLVLDQWWYYAFQRTIYADAINNNYLDWDNIFRQGGMDALAVKIDGTLTALFSGLSTFTHGTDGAALAITDFVASKKDLDGLDVPEGDRTWVLSTGAYADATQLEAISNMLYVGQNNTPVVSGKITREVWGSPVVSTTNLGAGATGKVGSYFHRQAFGLAMRKDPFSMPALDNPNTASREIALFAIWGVKELRDNFGVKLAMEI